MHAVYPQPDFWLLLTAVAIRGLQKTSPRDAGLVIDGGEGGIRTLDTLLTYTPLAGERLQPLGHFSRFCLCRFYKCQLFLMSLFPYQVMSYPVLSTYLRIAAYRDPRRLSYLFRTEVPRQASRRIILNFVQGSRSDATPHSTRSALKRSDTARLWATTRTS